MKRRFCNMCHKPAVNMVGNRCSGCRKIANMRINAQVKGVTGTPDWLKKLERQLVSN